MGNEEGSGLPRDGVDPRTYVRRTAVEWQAAAVSFLWSLAGGRGEERGEAKANVVVPEGSH